MHCRFLFVLILLLTEAFVQPCKAQVPEDSVKQGSDTIIIYEAPVIIKKSIYREPVTRIIPPNPWYIALNGAAFYDLIRYTSCDCYQDYFDLYKKSTKSSIGYSLQGSVAYLKKRIYAGIGIGYTIHQNSFERSMVEPAAGSKVFNKFNYFNIFLQGGYKIGAGKLSAIPTLSVYLNQAISSSGQSFHTITDTTYALNSVRETIFLRKYSWSASVSVKILYRVSKSLQLMAEPFYMQDLASSLRRPSLFYQQKSSIGLRIGVLYNL